MSKTEKALVLVRRGVPACEAARRVGIHFTCVYKAAKKLGITLPNGRRTGRPRVVKRRSRTFYPKVSKRVSHPELNEIFYSKRTPEAEMGTGDMMPDPRLREENAELRAEIRVLRSIIASAIKGRE